MREDKVRARKTQTEHMPTKHRVIHLRKVALHKPSLPFIWSPPRYGSVVSTTTAPAKTESEPDDLRAKFNLLRPENFYSRSRENMLPLYISDKSPYVMGSHTSRPDWLRQILPCDVAATSVIQAGKPWHGTDECTWAKDLRLMATSSVEYIPETSPKMKWGASVCSLEKALFNIEYKINSTRKSLYEKVYRYKSRSKSLKLDYSPPREIPYKPPPKPCDYKQSKVGRKCRKYSVINLSDLDLLRLTYDEFSDKKYIPAKPKVKGISKAWKYLTRRRFPPNAIRSTFFKDMIKPKPGLPVADFDGALAYGEWPYVEMMCKEKVFATHITRWSSNEVNTSKSSKQRKTSDSEAETMHETGKHSDR